jgi:Flp pilus assembly protein TadD
MNEAPVRARALQGRGIAALLLGDTTIGRESLEQAVAEDPALWRAWNALGFLEDSEQEWVAAEAHYGKALAQNSSSAMIYNNRGFSRMMQRRVGEAIQDLNHALQLDQEFLLAQENLRLAYAWDGKYHLALSGVEDRGLPRVLNNIGYIAILRKDFSQAEAYLHRAMELSPRYHQQAAKNLAFLEEQRGGSHAPSAAQLP